MTAPVLDGAEPALAEIHGAPLSDLHLKLWHLFARAAEAYPAHEALVSLWQPQDHRPGESVALRWSYAELRARAEALAASLAAEGCRPGMRLCVVLGNSAEWALFFWAAARLQMAFVPVDPTVAADARAMVLSVRPSVVVAQDGDGAAALDLVQAASLLQGPGLRIHCAAQEVEGWTRLCDVPASEHVVVAVEESPSLAESPSLTANPNQDDDNDNTNNTNNTNDDAAALIIFTSGTTGEPKGCPHTNRNLVSESCDFDPEVDPSVFLRWLVHTPASHIFAVNNALRAWRFGGAVVFPSRAFAVDATLHALVAERCSVMSATPTLVKALLAHPAFPGPGEHLRIVTIGGTAVGPADIQLCRRGLGAGAAIQVYGMSEGAPLVTFARTDPDLVDGYHPGVGKVLPGAAARVCRPGSRDVLRRGEVGELHVGGTSIITGYYGRGPDESMYRDAAGPWLATGDQASIDEQGVVYILGRYKDLIIRGGENIYPIRIESSLQELPGVQAHVVGVPDDFAGQVPVAVAILPEGTTKAQLIEKSRASDPRHALDAVYTLGDLGLDKFPVTSLGKVKKETLRQKLANLGQPEPPTPETQPAQKYTEKLLRVWEKLSGVRPAASDSVTLLADSITLLRYCDGVLRACGQRLYLQDFAEHDTVEKQAQLLLAREMQQARLAIAQPGHEASAAPVQQLHTSLVARRDRDGHSVDEADVWSAAQARVASVGLAVVDVEDVMAVRDSLHRTAIGLRPQSYHNRMVFRVRGPPYAQIRRGLERALASRPMLRAVVFEASNRAPFHAVLTPSPALFDKLIHHLQVDTEEEATQLSQDDSAEGHSSPFMFQSDLIEIAATDHHLLSFTFNHSVIDALSITQWHHELDRWLQDANVEIPALTPYRLFSDLFTQYQDSEPARRSVAFHVARLRGISRFRRALWPPQRAPGMLISNDAGCPRAEERRAARDAVWAGEWTHRAPDFRYPRSGRVVALPSLAALRDRHAVQPAVLARAAVVLFNVLQTGASHALFSSWESGRSWPFVPPWMDRLLPPAMSIDGPTAQWLLNMTEVVPDESVAAFLRRVAREQDLLKRHEHVPWNRVVQALRDEGDVAEAASFRQSFVWDVSIAMGLARADRADFKTLEPVARYDWADCGLFWNAFMIDSVNLYFIASWDTAQMNDREVDGHCDSLAEVMRKLADESNWERKIGDVFVR